MDLKSTLAERKKTHGSFGVNARLSQELKAIVRKGAQTKLSPEQNEALDMIMHKIARILAGNPNIKDHWVDLSGYATLVADKL